LTEVLYPPETMPAGYGHDIVIDRGDGFSDEPFIRLAGEELPPPGVQAIEDTWALVTLRGEPVAFISPEIVTTLDPDSAVREVLDELADAYVGDFGHPRDYFQANLAGRVARGRIAVFDQCAVGTRWLRTRLTELEAVKCAAGWTLEPGAICDDSCACGRGD